MSKELLLKLAADYTVLAEDLKKLAGEERFDLSGAGRRG